jgi:hypothetical protein
MRCSKAREWLSLARDGQLPPDKTISLDEHLQRCEACREYETDLSLGQRMLRATPPRPPENFEWRLQLKLQQTLQAAAQESALPWEDAVRPAWRGWWRNFGLSALAGAAAVIALAVLIQPDLRQTGPVGQGLADDSGSHGAAAGTASLAAAPRADLPLNLNVQPRLPFTRGPAGLPASSGRMNGGLFDARSPLVTFDQVQSIQRLQRENDLLEARLAAALAEVKRLQQAQLDTAGRRTLDLEEAATGR